MAILAATNYNPASSVNTPSLSGGTVLSLTAFDATNLALTFTAPANGIVFVRMSSMGTGVDPGSSGKLLLGVLDGSTPMAFSAARITMSRPGSTAGVVLIEGAFPVTGLTPGNTYTFKAAYLIPAVFTGGGFDYGGSNGSATARGGFCFEIYG